MIAIQYIVGGVFAVVALCAIAGNYLVAGRWLLGRASGSVVPLVGGLCGGLALVVLPLGNDIAAWCLIPLLLDLGTAPLLLAAALNLGKRRG